MRGIDVYLEAPSRTQELLNLKWTLKSAGFTIGSTWHENSGITSALPLSEHWDAKGVEQLRACDLLVVICGKDSKAALEWDNGGPCACARLASSLDRAFV